ncbi:MAG: hypothetical protein GX201_09025 [Clostridiales bacterium]|jgi:hypothetical protein|nr:hypothetical protein [Clostridiales bacterium]
MSLLKNLGNKALNTAKVVGSKSQDMMEIGKLKMQISQVEGEIKKLKSEIGEVVYNAYANGLGSPSDQVVSLCDSINAKYGEIEELKLKIQQVQND